MPTFLPQCQVDNDIEYEFPCFNQLVDPPEPEIWSPSDPRFDDPVYGGILLSINASTGTDSNSTTAAAASASSSSPAMARGGSPPLFGIMFPRLQACLRRHANRKAAEESYELYQWKDGSQLCCGGACL